MSKKALMLASVASMIDLFNMDNIHILKKLGYEVEVACNFEEGSITSQDRVDSFRSELEDDNIKTYQVSIPRSITKIKDIYNSYKVIKTLAQEKKYHIVHCHSPIGGVVCRLACRKVRKAMKTKVIYTAHGFHFFRGASKKAWVIFYPVERICSMFTDLLITINQEDYERAKKFKTCRVEFVPGIGVNTVEFKTVIVDRKKIRSDFGFSDDDFVFMSTGQVSIRKNHEAIIRAIALANDKKIKYLIVGFGEEEGRLKKLSEELNVNEQIVFAGYRSDVKQLLHIVDAYAFPSLQEGLPVSLMEAISVGLPIVCSRIRGNTDLVTDGQGGYMYDPNDYKGFAEGMKKIVEGDYTKIKNSNEIIERIDRKMVSRIMYDLYKSMSRS